MAEKKKEENNWIRKISFFAEQKENLVGNGGKYEEGKIVAGREGWTTKAL